METPDRWVLLKIGGEDPHYKIFASWRGGYLSGDSWRMNSGIVGVTKEGDFYLFRGASGSVYRCHKDGYGIASSYSASVADGYCKRSKGIIKLLKKMPKVMRMDWIIGK